MADIDNFVNTISDNLTKISQNLRNMAITMRPNKLRSNEEWREGYIKIPKSIINVDENKKTLTLNVIHNILLREAFFLPRIIFNIKPKTKIFIKALNDKLILEADITDNFKLYQITDNRVFIGIIKIDIQSFDEELLNKTNEDPDIPNECIIKFKPDDDENDKYKLLNCRLGAINEVYYYVDTVTRTSSLDLPLIRENNFPFQYGLRIPYYEHNSDVLSFIEQDYIDPEEQLDLPLLLILKPPFHKPYNLTKDEIYFLTFLNPILESQLIGSSTYHYGLASLAKLIKPEVKIKITNNKGFLREGIIDNVNFKPFNSYLQSTYTAHASIAFTIKNKTKNTGKINTETRDFSAKLSIPLYDNSKLHLGNEDSFSERVHIRNWNSLSLDQKVNDDWNILTPINFTTNKGQVTTEIPPESFLSNDDANSNNKYNLYNFSGRLINFKFYKLYALEKNSSVPGERHTDGTYNVTVDNTSGHAGDLFLSPYLNVGRLEYLAHNTNIRKKPNIYIYINNTLIIGVLNNVSSDQRNNGRVVFNSVRNLNSIRSNIYNNPKWNKYRVEARGSFNQGYSWEIPIYYFVKNIQIKYPQIYSTQQDIDKINSIMNNTNVTVDDTIDCTIKIQKNLNDFDYKNCSIEFIDDDLGGELKLPDSVEVPE